MGRAAELLIAFDAQIPIFPLLLSGEPFERIAPHFQYDAAGPGHEPPQKWFQELASAAGTSPVTSSGGDRSDDAPGSERLYGRARDVKALRDALVDHAVGTAIISGYAGTGKSALVHGGLRCTGADEIRNVWLDASRCESLEALELLVQSVETDEQGGSHADVLVVVLDTLPSRVLAQDPPSAATSGCAPTVPRSSSS